MPTLFANLAWQDHAVIVVYVCAMLALGVVLSLKQSSDEEYFLAGRNMPWVWVGMSVIASLLSSITYLAEPGEVWRSGTTHMWGKMLAIPFEMLFVFFICIPFFMRFRYTSAYEYLDHRFGLLARRLGVVLFLLLVVSWMGVVVLVSSRALSVVSGVALWKVISTVGVVATVYTMLGGIRAVIWTDVVQVILLVGGALFIVGYVAVTTGSGPGDWHAAVAGGKQHSIQFFNADPRVRATVVTVAMHMFAWHVCTHASNQMTVQRYFSTSDVRAARRSFVTASILGVGINLLLLVLGMALFYYYHLHDLPSGLDPSVGRDADKVFPRFVVEQLPPGVAGAILAAMLAAAMSTIDSGVNSVATVLSMEFSRSEPPPHREPQPAAEPFQPAAADAQTNPYTTPRSTAVPSEASRGTLSNHVSSARIMTAALGLAVTVAAYLLDFATGDVNIVEMMPKSFNCFLGALGGMFFAGMFLPRAGQRAVVPATLLGLAVSFYLAYSRDLHKAVNPESSFEISFTLVVFGSLVVTIALAWLFSLFVPPDDRPLAGLTWWTRRQPPPR